MFSIVPCSVKKSTRTLLLAELRSGLMDGAKEDGFDSSKHMPLHCFEAGEEGYFFITARVDDDRLFVCVGSLEWAASDRFVRIFVAPKFRRRGAGSFAMKHVLQLQQLPETLECEVVVSESQAGREFAKRFGWKFNPPREDQVNVTMEIHSAAELVAPKRPLSEDICITKPDTWQEHMSALLDLWEGEEDLFDDDERMAIAWDGSLAVGSITWTTDMLMNLRVRPSHRKRGIGFALVREAALDCFARGAQDVQIETVNPEAERLYASAGFVTLAKFEEYCLSFP